MARQCKYCNHCKQIGRQKSTRYTDGRKHYYCEHPDTKNIKDKHGYLLQGFISFGTNTWESPIALKTHPRWCPLEKHESKEDGKDYVRDCERTGY